MLPALLIACNQCDLLQYEVKLVEGEKACCSRCNALLYKNTAPHYNQEIAFTVSAIIMLIIANMFPIATIIVQGQVIDATLFDIIQTLAMQQQNSLALLVFITLLLAPTVELLAMAYLLMQLKWGWPKHYITQAYRLRLSVKTWVLTDVFMLGVLVDLVKLTPIVTVKVGIAVWALGGLIILLTALSQAFDTRKMWSQIDFHST
ncbi:MAG: paraquat-inducible protein A [Methylophilaceae bacterium]|nr:paraquat-inducible protein A [Methylophilaceae bacterium]